MKIDWTQILTAKNRATAAREAATAARRVDAKAYLAYTDSLVLRAIELGEAVPTELATQRAVARDAAREQK